MPVSVQHGSMTVTSTSNDPEAVIAGLQEADRASTDAQPESPPPAPSSEGAGSVAEPAEADAGSNAPTSVEADPPYSRAPDGTFQTKHRKGSLQYRIDQKSWEAGEARRQAQTERTERERLQARLAEYETKQQSPQAPAAVPAPTGKPTVDQFETYEDFVEALADWKSEQKFAARDAVSARQADAERVLNTHTQYTERQEQYAATVADYWEKVHSNANRALSPVMTQAILASEQGPAIIYYLSTHPEEVDQLTRETLNVPVDAAPLMRRLLESKVSVASASSPAQTAPVVRRSAPTPIKPVGSGLTVADTAPDDLPFGKAYVDEMNKRDLAKYKARLGR